MKKEIEIQQQNLKILIELMKENPTLRVVPMVDAEVVGDEGFNWWVGSFGEAEIDFVWSDNNRIYFKSNDNEELVNNLLEDIEDKGILQNISEDELISTAERTIEKLEWEKIIVVQIDVAC